MAEGTNEYANMGATDLRSHVKVITWVMLLFALRLLLKLSQKSISLPVLMNY